MSGCAKHVSNIASAMCGECGSPFCDECLVHPFGPNKPPMCIQCALAFAGVHHRGAPQRKRQKLSWSERRRRKQKPEAPVATPPVTLQEGRDFESFEIPAAS